MRSLLFLSGLLLAVTPLSAQFASQQSDPRLRTIAYTPGAVFTLRVVPGYVATVIFNPDERIESIALGNSAAWDVTPSKSGDHLFVKPLGNGAPTNVEVVTDTRHYSFLLQSTTDGDPEAAFRLRFDYASEGGGALAPGMMPGAMPGTMSMPGPMPGSVPGSMPAQPVAQMVVPQIGYRLSGDRLARPVSVSDDGERTLFVFADDATMPAIYALDDQGQEMLVTTRRVPEGWVVDRIWRRYVLRVGKATAQARRTPPKGSR